MGQWQETGQLKDLVSAHCKREATLVSVALHFEAKWVHSGVKRVPNTADEVHVPLPADGRFVAMTSMSGRLRTAMKTVQRLDQRHIVCPMGVDQGIRHLVVIDNGGAVGIISAGLETPCRN